MASGCGLSALYSPVPNLDSRLPSPRLDSRAPTLEHTPKIEILSSVDCRVLKLTVLSFKMSSKARRMADSR